MNKMPTEDFVKQQGLSYFAHLLRRVSDELVEGVEKWSVDSGLGSPARTRSTLMAVSAHGPLSITEIAALIHQTHPAVINWTRLLSNAGLVVQERDTNDGRRTLVSLTAEGKVEVERLRKANVIITAAYQDLMEDANADIYESLWRIEEACQQNSMQQRLENAARQQK